MVLYLQKKPGSPSISATRERERRENSKMSKIDRIGKIGQ